jgi:hypothetical protein
MGPLPGLIDFANRRGYQPGRTGSSAHRPRLPTRTCELLLTLLPGALVSQSFPIGTTRIGIPCHQPRPPFGFWSGPAWNFCSHFGIRTDQRSFPRFLLVAAMVARSGQSIQEKIHSLPALSLLEWTALLPCVPFSFWDPGAGRLLSQLSPFPDGLRELTVRSVDAVRFFGSGLVRMDPISIKLLTPFGSPCGVSLGDSQYSEGRRDVKPLCKINLGILWQPIRRLGTTGYAPGFPASGPHLVHSGHDPINE